MVSLHSKKIHGIECPRCGDRIWSRNRHDMRWCKCGYCAIDGGREYQRIIYGKMSSTESNPIPKSVVLTRKETSDV